MAESPKSSISAGREIVIEPLQKASAANGGHCLRSLQQADVLGYLSRDFDGKLNTVSRSALPVISSECFTKTEIRKPVKFLQIDIEAGDHKWTGKFRRVGFCESFLFHLSPMPLSRKAAVAVLAYQEWRCDSAAIAPEHGEGNNDARLPAVK
jgi:hypothetical protein